MACPRGSGLLVLAVVTSLPNMSTAVRLARQRRSDAAVFETFDSNTINLLGGIAVPGVVIGLGIARRMPRGRCPVTASPAMPAMAVRRRAAPPPA